MAFITEMWMSENLHDLQRGHADCGQHCGQRTADTQIRKFLTCPHFPLKWKMRTRKEFSYLRVRSPLSAVLSAVRMSAFST